MKIRKRSVNSLILIAVMNIYVGAEASQVIDNFEYASDANLQAVWQIETN